MVPREKHYRARRRWWQIICRISFTTLIVLGIAYATFPWWAPRQAIAHWIAGDMSRQLGVDVQIESLDLSWGRGITINNLSIASAADFHRRPMVTVERINADYSPLDILLNNRIAWADAYGPNVSACFDDSGNCNLAVLGRLGANGNSLQTDRLSVHQAVLTAEFPKTDKALRVNVSNLQMAAGRLDRLGSVTMSAGVAQKDMPAPLNLRLSGGLDKDSGGVASFVFSNLDLAQLNLPKILGLPMGRLAGRCSGSLELQITRQGVAEHVGLNILVKDLDAQPLLGPQMPVIDEAGLRIAAAFDPLADGGTRVAIQSASIRLPGIDLAGQAVIQGDLRDGDLGAIKSFDLYGEIQPTQLASLLRGGPRPAGAPGVEGPVSVQLSGQAAGQNINFQLAVDATKAVVLNKDKVIKPAGRTLQVKFAGGLDRQFRRLSADHCQAVLGGNELTFSGSIDKLWQMAARSLLPTSRPAKAMLDNLAGVALVASTEIHDLDSLRDLSPEIAAALAPVTLDGAITGHWSLEKQNDGTLFEANFRVPAETKFAVAQVSNLWPHQFIKPDGQAVTIDASAQLDPVGDGLSDIDLDINIAQGRLSVEHAQVVLEGLTGATVRASGRYSMANLDKLLAILPRRDPEVTANGEIDGRFDLSLTDKKRSLTVRGDLGRLELSVGRLLSKTVDHHGAVEIQLVQNDLPAGGQLTGSMDVDFPSFHFIGQADIAPSPADGARITTLKADLDVREASALPSACPMLADFLQDRQVSGPISVETKAIYAASAIEGSIRVNADHAEFQQPGQPIRTKPAGERLGAHLAGRVEMPPNSPIKVRLDDASVNIGQTSLAAAGKATLEPQPLGQAFTPQALLTCAKDFDFSVRATAAADGASAAILPELTDMIRQHQFHGQVTFAADANSDGRTMHLKSVLDATDCSVQFDDPRMPLRKPKDVPLTLSLDATAPQDLTKLDVKEIKLQAGEISVAIDAKADLQPKPIDTIKPWAPQNFHAVLETPNARALETFLPGLSPLQLVGDVRMEMLWTEKDDWRQIGSITFHSRNLAAHVNGKTVAVAGDLKLDTIGFDTYYNICHVGRVSTDLFEFAIGRNHGYLVADIADPLSRPTGTFDALCDHIDDKDITDWTQGQPSAASSQPAIMGPPESPRLQAAKLLEQLRPVAAGANITGHLRIDHFHRFDALVQQTYDPRCIDVDVSLADGRLKGSYRAGLNGGNYVSDLDTQITDAEPKATITSDLRDVLATDNMQPQLALFFPGNNVYGTFSRKSDETMLLVDLLAKQLNPYYPLRTVGTAVTVTTDGLLEGQAAPKAVTAVFPGLNLTQYRYNKMTAFATMQPDGTTDNDMIFDGSTYDTYITGVTDASNWGQYQIGLVLLGSPQTPELNHKLHLGRLLLLKLSARIEGGHLYDQSVAYPWPNEAVGAMLVRNNSLVQAWIHRHQ